MPNQEKRRQQAIRQAKYLKAMLDSPVYDKLLENYDIYATAYSANDEPLMEQMFNESVDLIATKGFSKISKDGCSIGSPAEAVWNHIFEALGVGAGSRAW